MGNLGRVHAALPDDLLNFHYDAVACAVALGWSGAVLEDTRLQPVLDGEVVRFQRHPEGRLTRVVVDLDGESLQRGGLRPLKRLDDDRGQFRAAWPVRQEMGAR